MVSNTQSTSASARPFGRFSFVDRCSTRSDFVIDIDALRIRDRPVEYTTGFQRLSVFVRSEAHFFDLTPGGKL
jgi:hypothetical protein